MRILGLFQRRRWPHHCFGTDSHRKQRGGQRSYASSHGECASIGLLALLSNTIAPSLNLLPGTQLYAPRNYMPANDAACPPSTVRAAAVTSLASPEAATRGAYSCQLLTKFNTEIILDVTKLHVQ